MQEQRRGMLSVHLVLANIFTKQFIKSFHFDWKTYEFIYHSIVN